MVNLSQKRLNEQVNKWLTQKNSTLRIDSSGDCLRRTLIWLLHAKQRDLTNLYANYEKISGWDGISTTTVLEDEAFERFLAFNDTMQRPGNIAYHIQPDKLNRHKKKELTVPNLKSSSVKSLIWELAELINFLEKEAQEGEMLLLNSQNHAFGLIYLSDTYFFYDPNNPEGHVPCKDIYVVVRELMSKLDCDTKHIPLSVHRLCFEQHFTAQENTPFPADSGTLSARVSHDGMSATMLAAQNNDLQTLHFLATKEGLEQTDHEGMNAFYLAAQNGHEDCLRYLLSLGANIDFQGPEKKTPLYVAAKNNHLNVCVQLISLGADIDKPAEDGTSPLHVAAEKGNENIVFNLIRAGANVNNQAEEDGSSPLYVAVLNSHEGCVKILLNTPDIRVNIQLFDDGTTPLHIACEQGDVAIVSHLLAHPDIDVNVQAEDLSTPLHNACESGSLEIIMQLIAKGAQINVKNEAGMTPLAIVCNHRHAAAAQELLKRGASPAQVSDNDSEWLQMIISESNDAPKTVFSEGERSTFFFHNTPTPAVEKGHKRIKLGTTHE
ncbi:TPA: ankyrin repeat domain-containing protein [Legionella feeleii]